jgi:putative spermidine/putrescine transport system substrate-binding protein
MSLTRRELLERTAAASVAGPLVRSRAQPIKLPLRISTMGIEWPDGTLQQAQLDLNLPIQLAAESSVDQVQTVLRSPDSFDVFSGYSYQAMRVWFAGHLRPVDTRRIAAWRDLYRLFAWGRLTADPSCRYGLGDAPFRSLFLRTGTTGLPRSQGDPIRSRQIVQWIDQRTGKPYANQPMPRYVTGVPAHFAAESLGYLRDVIQKAPEHVSWAQLLNARWKGRVAIQNDPAVALVDLAQAVQALGVARFGNVAALTVAEVDRLIKILIAYRKRGQFRGTWSSFNEVVNLMASKDVAISPLWPSAAGRIAAEGVRIAYAVPPEGYRGSCSAIGISAHVPEGPRLEACYAYLNWLYAGYFGAEMMRQGYYVGNGAQLPHWIETFGESMATNPFSPAEYRYWYEGRPAVRPLPGAKGTLAIKRGAKREGGSLAERMCRCTTWASYFHSAGYQARRFKDFVGA